MAEQTTALRASRQSARRFTLTLYDHEAQSLEAVRQHLSARSSADTVRRLIIDAAVRVRMNQPLGLFDGLSDAAQDGDA